MKINTQNPIIVFSEKGKAFAYSNMLYATLNKYILEYKNVHLDMLTDNDIAACLMQILKKMEVNEVPVLDFFKYSLKRWNDLSENERVRKLCEVIAKDIFCCFDKNLYDENGNFATGDRIFCVNNNGVKDYIYCEDYVKKGLFKKVLTPESEYFKNLMERNKRGELPVSE